MYEASTPISQVASASTVYIFGQHRVNQIKYFGGVVSQEERDGFALMWRGVARIEGANNQLLGRTHAEEFDLQTRQHQFLHGRSERSVRMTADVVAGTSSMAAFGRSRRLNHAVVRQLLAPSMVETLPGYDVQDDLGLTPDPVVERAFRAATFVLKALNQATRLPAVRRYFDENGQRMLDSAVERGLGGVKAQSRGTPVAGKPTDQ